MAARARTLSPGGSATVFMDVSFADGETLPPSVKARITATRQAAGKDGKPMALPKDRPAAEHLHLHWRRRHDRKARRGRGAAAQGAGWMALNGCCDAVTSHRGAVMAINGRLRVPERFAIDWIKLDDAGRVFTGDASKLDELRLLRHPDPCRGGWRRGQSL